MGRSTTTAYSNDPERFHLAIFSAAWRGWSSEDMIKLGLEAHEELAYHAQQQAMVDAYRKFQLPNGPQSDPRML